MINKFLKRVVVFSIIVLLTLCAYIYSFNIGSLDFYYKRISSPKQTSLILGNSRAAQGLVPDELNKILNLKDNPLYNFSFTANYSPYGEVYYNAIISKLKDETHNGVFILSVDPGSISASEDNPNDESEFVDNNSFLNHINCFSCNPNLDYIIYGHETFYKKVFLNMIRGRGYLHDDGWLEMKLKNDSISRSSRLKSKLSNKNYASNYTPSEVRLEYLKKTIDVLKEKGDVYMVRLPMHKDILERQENALPQFEQMMNDISTEKNIPYFSFINDSHHYLYSDGSHLTPESARKISIDIANKIHTYK